MNKQEAIRELMSKSREIIFGDDENVYLSRKRTIDLISQIDEQQKVVIPKFVAQWIEGCKRSGWHLQKALYRMDDDEKVGDWAYDENDDLIFEKGDVFARAWLDGYEIEQEPLYVVVIPDDERNKFIQLWKNRDGKLLFNFEDEIRYGEVHLLTEKEIKQKDKRLWQFAKPVEDE